MNDRSTPQARPVDLLTVDVAALLGVPPNTIRQMGQKFGFPTPCTPVDGRRRFALDEILALRRALRAEHSVAAAVQRARAEVSGRRMGDAPGGILSA